MPDDFVFLLRFFLKFCKEIRCTGKRNLVDVFFDLIGCHANAVVYDLQRFLILIQHNADRKRFILRKFRFAQKGKLLQLCYGITGVGYQFADKDIFIRIEPFFDNRQKIFTVYG